MDFDLFSIDDDKDDFFGSNLFGKDEEANCNNSLYVGGSNSNYFQKVLSLYDAIQSSVDAFYCRKEDSLKESMRKLGQSKGVHIFSIQSDIKLKELNVQDNIFQVEADIMVLQAKQSLVKRLMGTMALCRGNNGVTLFEAGAIQSLLSMLFALMNNQGDSIKFSCPSLELSNYSNTNDHDLFMSSKFNEQNMHEDTDNCVDQITLNFDISSALPTICSNFTSESKDEKNNYYNKNDEDEKYKLLQKEKNKVALDLAIISMGALRDLACGNAANRSAIFNFKTSNEKSLGTDSPESLTGIQIISNYVRRYKYLTWGEILSQPDDPFTIPISSPIPSDSKHTSSERGKKELRLFANVAGVVRNATHSTKSNCDAFYKEGTSELFIWQLKHGTSLSVNNKSLHKEASQRRNIKSNLNNIDSTNLAALSKISLQPPKLPESTDPWREVCYRISSSLINMAEKSHDCAAQCGQDISLIYLLIESWGGFSFLEQSDQSSTRTKSKLKTTPMLHLGLAAILHVGQDKLRKMMKNNQEMNEECPNEFPLLDSIALILEKEEERKNFAQKKEANRKEILSRKLANSSK